MYCVTSDSGTIHYNSGAIYSIVQHDVLCYMGAAKRNYNVL